MDVGKWLADTAKEAVGVNDFKKAKDAYDRMDATSKNVDYSGDTWSDIKNVLKATPSYTKDAALSVGNSAVGAGKALVNVGMMVVPAGRANKAATAITSKFTPKITTPNKLSGGRQFSPKPSGGGGTATKTRTQVETKTDVEAAPKTSVKTEPTTKPETKTKGQASSKKGGRTSSFTAGAAAAGLAGSNNPKGDGPWTPSAIV
jgi:hypothetical protein